jgi:hypothetical protein
VLVIALPVVSAHTVLAVQRHEAISGFNRTKDAVVTITGETASKIGELAQALSGGKKIVVCTIQILLRHGGTGERHRSEPRV